MTMTNIDMTHSYAIMMTHPRVSETGKNFVLNFEEKMKLIFATFFYFECTFLNYDVIGKYYVIIYES